MGRGGGVILLICEWCQRPLAGESVSGGVTYSDNTHAGRGSGLSLELGGALEGGGVLGNLPADSIKKLMTNESRSGKTVHYK